MLQALRFLASQVDHPGFLFVADPRRASAPGQVFQGGANSQLQRFAQAALNLGTMGAQHRRYRRYRLSLGIAQQNLGALHLGAVRDWARERSRMASGSERTSLARVLTKGMANTIPRMPTSLHLNPWYCYVIYESTY